MKRWIEVIYLCACLIGFTIQVAKLSAQYLEYGIFTRTRMEIARYIQAPQLHLCPATYQVFDFELYNAKFNTTLGNIAGSEDIYAFQTMITVSQLLEYSYPAQDLVVFCAIRRPHSNAVKYLGREECTDIFSLTKYFIYEYICYKVDLKPGKGGVLYDTHRLGCAVNHPGLFFELRINPKWLTSMRTFKILSAQKKEGEKRIGGAQMIEIGWFNGSALFNRYIVSHYKISYKRLPPPYKTMCRDYLRQGFQNSRECSSICMNRQIVRKLNRHWYALHQYDPVERRPLSAMDFRNTTITRLVDRIFYDCQAMCGQKQCDKIWTVTLVRSQRYQNSHFMFSAIATNQPSFYVVQEPQLTIEPYLVLVMSCVGSWFGLSVLSFRPACFVKPKAPVSIYYPFKIRSSGLLNNLG